MPNNNDAPSFTWKFFVEKDGGIGGNNVVKDGKKVQRRWSKFPDTQKQKRETREKESSMVADHCIYPVHESRLD